jgi:hypothetical protein
LYGNISNRNTQRYDDHQQLPFYHNSSYGRALQAIELGRAFQPNADGPLRYPRYQQDQNLSQLQAQVAAARAAIEYQQNSFAPVDNIRDQPQLSLNHGISGNNVGSSSSSIHRFRDDSYRSIVHPPSELPKPLPTDNVGPRNLSPLPTPMQLVQQPSYLRRASENEMRYRSLLGSGDAKRSGLSRALSQVNAADPSFDMNPCENDSHRDRKQHSDRLCSNYVDMSESIEDEAMGETVVIDDNQSTEFLLPPPKKRKKRTLLKDSGSSSIQCDTLMPSLPITELTNDGTVVLTKDFVNEERYKNLRTTTWFLGCAKLETPEDKHFLQPLQNYLRSNLVEVFTCGTDEPFHGKGAVLALGQVAVRCIFCKNTPHRAMSSFSVPHSVAGLYNAVQDVFRKHFPRCTLIPDGVRQAAITLDEVGGAKGGKRKYW